MKIIIFIAITVVMLGLYLVNTQTKNFALLIPAYANPCCGDGPDMWRSMIDIASNHKDVALYVIFNPANGPGQVVDPNYITDAGSGPLPELKSSHAIIFGYVATNYGKRKLDTVKADVDRYFDTLYKDYIDGIFFDEMSNDLAKVGYYHELQNYVKSKQPKAQVIGNPGVTATINPSHQTQWSVADYVDSADVLVTYENTADNYTSYAEPSWLNNKKANHFAHIIHSMPQWNSSLVETAMMRKAGYLYATQDKGANPYDASTNYWGELIEAANTSRLKQLLALLQGYFLSKI